VHGEVYGKRFARESVVGAIDKNNNFFAGFAFKGYMNSDLFEGWLESVFVPAIKERKAKNPILIIDNASHHPKEKIQTMAEQNGFSVIFLPKYSPDLNFIETYWANIKNWLRLHLHKFHSFWEGFVRAFRVR
jgi:transposase